MSANIEKNLIITDLSGMNTIEKEIMQLSSKNLPLFCINFFFPAEYNPKTDSKKKKSDKCRFLQMLIKFFCFFILELSYVQFFWQGTFANKFYQTFLPTYFIHLVPTYSIKYFDDPILHFINYSFPGFNYYHSRHFDWICLPGAGCVLCYKNPIKSGIVVARSEDASIQNGESGKN